jgi:hypothetical protein
MTAKEKANHILDKFWLMDKVEPMLTKEQAKQCALIAVDEIILANPHSNPLNTDVHSTMSYWQEIKHEIEKL